MAESDSGGEKTESPSQKKRDDARKEGQVAFSKELSSCALLGGFLLMFYFTSSFMLDAYKESMMFAFRNLNLPALTIPSIRNFFIDIVREAIIMTSPFLGSAFVIGIMASVAQVGFKITAKPLAPKLSKISPLKGLGRMFSKQAGMELLKTIFKMVLFGYIGLYTFQEEIGEIQMLIDQSPKDLIPHTALIVSVFMFRAFLALLVIAVFDYMFQRFDLEQKLKMTKQEVKEEHKQAEGDPQLKAKIRQIQQQMSQSRMMQEVPESDVVVSNPTHFAIALKYDREYMRAPQITAKGVDHLALRMMEIAGENNVIVYRNPPVARAMYFQVDVGDEVPEEFYKAVAEILAFVYKSKKKR